jgi:hypothetical protein
MWLNKIVFYNNNNHYYKCLPKSIMLTMKYIKQYTIVKFILNFKSTRKNNENNKYIMSLGVWNVVYRSETINHMIDKIYI